MTARVGTYPYTEWYDAADVVLQAKVVDDAFPRFVLTADGTMSTGDGTAAPVAVDATVSTSTVTGTTDELALADAGTVKRYTAAGAVTVTVPAAADVAFVTGTVVGIYSAGAGGVTIAPAGGVTIRNNASALSQYEEVSIRKDGTNEWVRS